MTAALPALLDRSPFADSRQRFSAGKFGVGLFLASLGMLFAASIIGFLVIRLGAERWPTDLPSLPKAMWGSTAVLILSTVTFQWGLQRIRKDDRRALKFAAVATLALGGLFLLLQGWCWWTWQTALVGRLQEEPVRFALSGFYVLTGVHAAHVIAGLIPLAVVTRNALRQAYSGEDHAGVQYCAMYWHFLDGVWLVLFCLLLIGV